MGVMLGSEAVGATITLFTDLENFSVAVPNAPCQWKVRRVR
jgi:hypothetical protein